MKFFKETTTTTGIGTGTTPVPTTSTTVPKDLSEYAAMIIPIAH